MITGGLGMGSGMSLGLGLKLCLGSPPVAVEWLCSGSLGGLGMGSGMSLPSTASSDPGPAPLFLEPV